MTNLEAHIANSTELNTCKETLRAFRLLIISTLLLTFSLSVVGQYITREIALDSLVLETSGLIFLDQRLITHNDSYGEPALYEIDTITGNIVRKVIIRNAVNRDWEDICYDSKYIYVGDFGNNYGNRKDLCIYRLLKSDYLTTKTDSIDAEIINFSYVDQKDFSPNVGFTNYDTEALISYKDSLYIFTKNWRDGLSYIYRCPKEPGTYRLEITDIINAKGLVTGATYNEESNSILICGYVFFFPFLIEISDFTSDNFSGGSIKRYLLPLEGSTQIEGITWGNDQRYFFSSEANKRGESALYSFDEIDLSMMKVREKQLGKTLLIKLMSMVKDTTLVKLFWKAIISLL